MNILGLNTGYALPKSLRLDGFRRKLGDGSAALLADRRLVFAGIEERHTRKRYEGGFKSILKSFSESELAENISNLDVIAVSSCCAGKWPETKIVKDEILCDIPPEILNKNPHETRLIAVGHHESHAALGFVLSGFDRALVAVVDGFGNLLDDSGWCNREWWRGIFERHSYYVAERIAGGFRLSLLCRDAEGRDDIGLGEAYRAMVYFCGWDSYQHAGSAMSLAAYGDPNRFRHVPFFQIDEFGRIKCNLQNEHKNPSEIVTDFFRQHGHEGLEPLEQRSATQDDKNHCDAVRAVQDQLTEVICHRLLRLAGDTGCDKIVVTGGVAMNCLAMGELQRRFSGRVFIPPAPSDTGQGLGNAIWAASCVDSPFFVPDGATLHLPNAPFWGLPIGKLDQHDLETLNNNGLAVTEVAEADQYREAAKMLAAGKILAVAQGRSEYGPRALGRRSVLADPRNPQIRPMVNSFKKRETYRPFAPAILSEYMEEYCSVKVESPFMSFAVKMCESTKTLIPAVLHADDTARFQTVEKDSSSPLRPILEHFHALTGVPVLLNTSFNRRGEPIVQTVKDAINAFVDSKLDALLLDNAIITRVEDP